MLRSALVSVATLVALLVAPSAAAPAAATEYACLVGGTGQIQLNGPYDGSLGYFDNGLSFSGDLNGVFTTVLKQNAAVFTIPTVTIITYGDPNNLDTSIVVDVQASAVRALPVHTLD